jgi:multiple inositol-polyphosphate phosphatase/2,3-bisphosphoglycerate 3-phosphatase
VYLAYTMCRYDKAIHFKRVSPWCAIFSRSDLAVLEYIEDLESFYKESYGYDINWRQACKAVEDLVTRFTYG